VSEPRCAIASEGRHEPLTGTASPVRAFLLVENAGPWGVDALRNSRLPLAVKESLAERAAEAGVRVLLVRKHGRATPRADLRVFAAYAAPERPWTETATLAGPEALADLDLASFGAGRSPGLTSYTGQLLCVCTHGRHDTCCAERGRPVAAMLAQRFPEQTWEVSHIGGDRFAGNLLVLPTGLYYGRLDPSSAIGVAEATGRGELVLEHLRGRSGYGTAVQSAEIYLRRELGEVGNDSVRLVTASRDGAEVTAEFSVLGTVHRVRVRRVRSAEPHRLTCQALRPNQVVSHELVNIEAP
jgi:hypothetical protein